MMRLRLPSGRSESSTIDRIRPPQPKPTGLRQLEVGDAFTGFYIIRKKELRTKRDGGFYLSLEIGDASGRLSGNIWDDAERLYTELEEGGILKAQGVIEQYRDGKSVVFKRFRKSVDTDDVDISTLLPTIEGDPKVLLARLFCIIERMKNPHLQRLLTSLFAEDSFRNAYMRAPGGKLWHHNRIGGLLEHTLSLIRVTRMLSRFYPEVDGDLLLAGTILHDVGKIEEYRYDTLIDYTDRGRLVGHISIGADLVTRKAETLDDFPAGLLDQLLHLILSHQAEHGSPVQPATREAFLLHYADQIDSKMDALKRIEADLPAGQKWLFVKLLDRHINFGDSESRMGTDRQEKGLKRT